MPFSQASGQSQVVTYNMRTTLIHSPLQLLPPITSAHSRQNTPNDDYNSQGHSQKLRPPLELLEGNSGHIALTSPVLQTCMSLACALLKFSEGQAGTGAQECKPVSNTERQINAAHRLSSRHPIGSKSTETSSLLFLGSL